MVCNPLGLAHAQMLATLFSPMSIDGLSSTHHSTTLHRTSTLYEDTLRVISGAVADLDIALLGDQRHSWMPMKSDELPPPLDRRL